MCKMEVRKFKFFSERTDEEKEKILKDAKAAGVAGSITGLSALGLHKLGTKSVKAVESGKASETAKEIAKYVKAHPKEVASLKAGGLTLALTGAGLAGTAAYMHHKHKKKKAAENDSNKK
jgi:hypothetical protein